MFNGGGHLTARGAAVVSPTGRRPPGGFFRPKRSEPADRVSVDARHPEVACLRAAGPAHHDPDAARSHDRTRLDRPDAVKPVGRAGAVTPSNDSARVPIGTRESPSRLRAGVVILMARHQPQSQTD
jgi:hypothetical protein